MARSLARFGFLVLLLAGLTSLAGCRSARLHDGPAATLAPSPTVAAGTLQRASVPTYEWVATAATVASQAGESYRAFHRVAAPAASGAKDSGGGSGDLAKAAQNPIANMISLPFQNNTNFGIGPYDRTQNILNIQPVVPVKVGKWLVVNRMIAPIIYQPDITREDGGWTGLGDINYTAFIVPPTKGKVMWGVGPVVLLPTRTDDHLGKGEWGLGPSAVALVQPGKWVIGVLVNNIWSVGGSSDGDGSAPEVRNEINQMLLQYFVNYNLPQGWYLTSAPIITANWKAEPGQKWVVPFGGGFGKIFKIGKQPFNASLQAYYSAVKPDDGAEWQLRFQIQLLFPTGK